MKAKTDIKGDCTPIIKSDHDKNFEAIILSCDVFGRKGFSSILTKQGVMITNQSYINAPEEVLELCTQNTGVVIYFLVEGTLFDGIFRSMISVRAKWPNLTQIIMCRRFNYIFSYFCSALGGAKICNTKISTHSMGELLTHVIQSFCSQNNETIQIDSFFNQTIKLLTKRQRSIFQLLAENLSINEIASRLDLRPQTVRSHTYQALRRLGLCSISDKQALYQMIDEIIAISTVGLSSPCLTLAVIDAMSLNK